MRPTLPIGSFSLTANELKIKPSKGGWWWYPVASSPANALGQACCWWPATSFGAARLSLRLPLALEKGGFGRYTTYGTCMVVWSCRGREVICEARQGCLPERNASREGHTSYIAVFSHHTPSRTLKEPTRATLLKIMGDVACWVAYATRLSMLCCDRQSC